MKIKYCVSKIHQGGGVAAPVGGQIFSEILPYLEVNQSNTDEIEVREKINVLDVIGMSITNAIKVLKEQGFEPKINNEENVNKDETLVTEQIPAGGIEALSGSGVYLN